MATWAAPKSCLSESLREYENNSSQRSTENISLPYKNTPRNNSTLTETWDPMTELDSILHSANNAASTSVVFGCTPPSRSTNPITRDRNFANVKSMTLHHSTKAFKTSMCKETWGFMAAPTYHTFH